MKVYGVIGWKNAGKTGLMERLVAEITGRGFAVSTVKHVHHDVDLDRPGKDTFRHRAAGAREVVLAGARRHAILTEHRDGPEPELATLLRRLAPVDLVLVEGYKRDSHPRIEVFRAATGQALIQPGDPHVRAVATDAALPPLPVPVLDLNDTVAVADFILRETGLLPVPPALFDTVVVVDWSSAGSPSPAAPSANAVWMGVAGTSGETVSYHRTRAAAEAALGALLDAEAGAGRRVLTGFDFAFGYPAGFAARLTGRPEARAVWQWLAKNLTDAADNRNDRFALADRINARLGGHGPFWGRPRHHALAHLPQTKAVDYAALGLAERRRVEAVVRRAQPVWKLYTTGSVGGQVLTGLPVIARLAARPGASVWPFDPPTGPLVLAEIYPALIGAAVTAAARPGDVRDEVQVRLLARALWRLAQSGGLGPLLHDVPVWPGRNEEGWILGAGRADVLAGALA
jgi:molybdopterin-guanine dinucleotide biosynthesis protein B